MTNHRALCRVVSMDETHVYLEVVGYSDEDNPFPVALSEFQQPLREFLEVDYRFHGCVMFDSHISGLSDFECDGRTLREQTEAIQRYEREKFGGE